MPMISLQIIMNAQHFNGFNMFLFSSIASFFFFLTFNSQNSSSRLLGTPSVWVLDIYPTVFGSLLGLCPHRMFWNYLEYFFLQMWKVIPFTEKWYSDTTCVCRFAKCYQIVITLSWPLQCMEPGNMSLFYKNKKNK